MAQERKEVTEVRDIVVELHGVITHEISYSKKWDKCTQK